MQIFAAGWNSIWQITACRDKKQNKNVKCALHSGSIVLLYKCKARFTFYRDGDKVNNRIKEYRKQRKLTQDDLARAVDVTRQTIIALESGRYDASLKLAYRIARYFNAAIEDIFLFEEEK